MDAEQAANAQEIEGLRSDIDLLKGELVHSEQLRREEVEAHNLTKQKLNDIRGIIDG